MALFIHVVSATKTPENRGGNSTPFENFASNPNDEPGSSFGEGERTMFLGVVDDAPPEVDEVLGYLQQITTPDVLGIPRAGHYVALDGLWHRGFTVVGNTLEDAQGVKLYQLEEARAAVMDLGYTASNGFVFPLTEETFSLLQVRAKWLQDAINDGTEPPGATVAFRDRDGAELTLGQTALRAFYLAYGQALMGIETVAVDARAEILAAETPAEVAAVTWEF